MKTFADMADFFNGRMTYYKRNGNHPRLTTEQIGSEWVDRFGAACPDCGKPMIVYASHAMRQGRANSITVDHIRARSIGGTNDLTNQRCICQSCNCAKSLGEWKIANGVEISA